MQIPPLDRGSAWKNKKTFSSLLISYCNRAFEKFPGYDVFPKVLLCLHFNNVAGRGGGAESQALRLFPRQGNGAVESRKMACRSHSSEQRLSIQHFLNRSITPQKGARGGGW